MTVRPLPSRYWLTLAYVVLIVAVAAALFGVQHNQLNACHDRKHQWSAVHDVIYSAYEPTAPSDQVLNAFPSLLPFYTPGSMQYELQQASLQAQRDRVLAKLGDRPVC